MDEPLDEANEVGPVYNVPLLKTLPIPGSEMLQALPSLFDLEMVRNRLAVGERVVAGYEVLLCHYRKATAENERLRDEIHALNSYIKNSK